MKTTFQILDAVAVHQPIGLSELARRLGLPKSTVQRSLATLAELGWIRADGQAATRWMLGEHARRLSEMIDDFGHLRDVVSPVLDRLNKETLETIHLAIPDGRMMRLVERRESKHALRLVRPVGAKSPLHAGSTGKCVLAYLPPAEIENYIDGGLEAQTPHTTVDPERLRVELEDVRSTGYATTMDELFLGITSVAASIRPLDGRPIAAVSISGASSRIPADVRADYGRLVAAATQEIMDSIR
ncbi:IclR family transcriptional regulator [Streptomyces sp. NPDC127079]|uniref:IclR family transcriptional regulator n=1 Tax=Streptomyces sp. NPDC127079 TaxID=3347132 RepID=UPI00365637F8